MQLAHLFVVVLITSHFSICAAGLVPEYDKKITRQSCEERYPRQVNAALACVLYAYQNLLPNQKFELRPGQFKDQVTFFSSADDSFISWFQDEITGYLGFVYGRKSTSPMKKLPPLHPRDYWTLGWKPEADEVRQLVTASRKSDMDQKVACAQEALQPHLPSVLPPLISAYFKSTDQGVCVQDLIDLGWPQEPRALGNTKTKDTLQLYGCGLTSLRGLQASEAEMKTIKCIDLRCNEFESIVGEDEAVLAQFKGLERLLLDNNKKLVRIGKLFMTIPSLRCVSIDECTALLNTKTRGKWYEEPLSFGGQYDPSGMRIVYHRDPDADFTEEVRQQAIRTEQDQQSRADSVEEDSMGDVDQSGDNGAKAEEHE